MFPVLYISWFFGIKGLIIAKQNGAILGNPRAKDALKAAQGAIQARKSAFVGKAVTVIEEILGTGVSTYAKLADCMNKRGEKTPRGSKWKSSNTTLFKNA